MHVLKREKNYEFDNHLHWHPGQLVSRQTQGSKLTLEVEKGFKEGLMHKAQQCSAQSQG